MIYQMMYNAEAAAGAASKLVGKKGELPDSMLNTTSDRLRRGYNG
jgi:hypothetical protein